MFSLKIGSAWKETVPYVRIGGSWREVQEAYVKTGGVWRLFYSSAGKYELLADIGVSTNTTRVDISGLNITEDDEIFLVADCMAGSSSTQIRIYINGNETEGNYRTQNINMWNLSYNASKASYPYLFYSYGVTGYRQFAFVDLGLAQGNYFTFKSRVIADYGRSDTSLREYWGRSNFSVPSINTLTIFSSQAGGIGAGSRFKLYKKNGV